jgi:hypothetical protein
MRGNIVSSWIMAKLNYFSYKTLIFKHIGCKNCKELKIGAKKNAHAFVPFKGPSGQIDKSKSGTA